MALSQLFAENALVRLFLGNSEHSTLAISMTGIKLGERLLVIGLADPALLSALGSKVGITGRACGIDASPERATRAARRAERDGILAEASAAAIDELPFEPEGFDIVVVRAAADLAAEPALARTLAVARAALRDGGRCQIILDGAARGLHRLWHPAPAGLTPARVVQLLAAADYRGSRVLAERLGLAFVEGVSVRRSPLESGPATRA